MKNVKLSTLIVVLVLCLLVSPLWAGSPAENPKDYSHWLHSLSKEKQTLVNDVMVQNLDYFDTCAEEGIKDFNGWYARIAGDLQPILSKKESQGFIDLTQVNTQLTESYGVTCTECNSALFKLNMAYGHLASAYSQYDKSYCDYAFYTDQVKTTILIAKSRTGTAADYANDAYRTCNCFKISMAISDANMAIGKVSNALANTNRFCSGNPPWYNHTFSASIWLNNAISRLNACKAEASCL
ncbi:MAG: hypothetical protein GY765_13625 [bacterium]|nr:hypothetical protein [bacterium]